MPNTKQVTLDENQREVLLTLVSTLWVDTKNKGHQEAADEYWKLVEKLK